MTLFHRIRLRVFAVLVAVGLVVIAAISWASLPVWPVVGVAFAAVALVVNNMTNRLSQPVCWGCGQDISKQHAGAYGRVCPSCGSVTLSGPSADDHRQA
ncbi:MAG: hypothetical protein ACKVW3_15850 [Phycisphaerales bacterium]